MTDTINQPAKGGIAKATASGVYLDVCLNVTPNIVGYLCQHYPILNEAVWFQIVVFSLGTLGSFFVWATPQHFADACVDVVTYIVTTWRRILNAAKNPN